MQNDTQNIIGVDVGSGSVRAGVFNLRGELLAHATREITLFRSAGNRVEQSSREIWQAVCYCIKTAVASAGLPPSSIAGIGFDATCSLVVIGDNDAPLAVGPSDDPDRNIIVWMDHRATAQAEKKIALASLFGLETRGNKSTGREKVHGKVAKQRRVW